MMLVRGVLAMMVAVAMAGYARAAEETKPAAAVQPGGAEAAEFKQVVDEWKQLLAKLGPLQADYKQATDAKQLDEIQRQWDELMGKAEEVRGRMQASAEKAYLAAPNADPEITELLLNIIGSSLRYDDYEDALRLARLLMDHGCKNKTLTSAAAIAAFQSNDFPAAQKYLAQARASQTLEMDAREVLLKIDNFLPMWEREQGLRMAEAKADDLPRVLLKTTKGDMVIELFENEAPNTVANFVSLVEKKFYDGVAFHRVLPGFMAQGGDPKGDGTGGPGYAIACECYKPDARQHFRGSFSMANRGPDTGGSQFFLTFVPTSHLNGKHTVFGRVISGFDVLAKLQRRNPEAANQPAPDKIIEAKVLRKRDHAYTPTTTPEPGA